MWFIHWHHVHAACIPGKGSILAYEENETGNRHTIPKGPLFLMDPDPRADDKPYMF
jgi:hypothetical protein